MNASFMSADHQRMKDTDLGDIVVTFVDHQFKQNIGAPQ